MASVHKLVGPDGKARGWKVRYRTPDDRERARTFVRKGDADRFAVEIESSKLSGLFLDDRRGRMSVRAYGAEWRAAQLHRAGTARKVDRYFVGHVDPFLGDMMMINVRQSHLRALVAATAAPVGPLAPVTLRNWWAYVRSLFKAAVADRAIPFSPCDGIRLDAVDAEPVRPPTVDEVLAIAGRLPARWAAVAEFGAQTGMRPGELLGLCVDQVDFLRRTVRVDRQLRDGLIVFEPKTAKSNRTIPLDDVTVGVLAAHLAAWPALGPDGLVFHDGVEALRDRSVRKIWARATVRAGIGRRVRMHDLRHFHASALIGAGRSVVEVQSRLGHKRASETLDIYSHLFDRDDEARRGAMDAVFSAGVSSACPGRDGQVL